MPEISLHSFSTYIHLILSSSLCTRKDWQCLVGIIKAWITINRIFNCFLYKWQSLIIKTIFAKTATVDLGFLQSYWSLYSSSTFSTWNEPAIFYNRHVFHANLKKKDWSFDKIDWTEFLSKFCINSERLEDSHIWYLTWIVLFCFSPIFILRENEVAQWIADKNGEYSWSVKLLILTTPLIFAIRYMQSVTLPFMQVKA